MVNRNGRKPVVTKEQALMIRDQYLQGKGILALELKWHIGKTVIVKVINGTHVNAQGLPNITRNRKSFKQIVKERSQND